MDFAPRQAADGAWLAPAKLNLTLRIVGRRADGYHLLQSVFQFIDRCDRLFFEPRDDGQVRRVQGAKDVPEERDLVVRAARLLQRQTGCQNGVDIRVDKQLPMGGGLGGGSSDAATTLHALNQLWDLELGIDQLAALGLELGADVPVFVRARAAWAEGVGEQLEPVALPEPWYLVLVPPCQVSTAAVFSDPDLTRDSAPITIAGFVGGDDRNDCLPVVLRRYAPVAEAFRWLDARAKARLTGTGCCLFAAFDDQARAEQLRAEAPVAWSAFVAKGCNHSPLMRTP
ncbi:4-(cytidine 5'-diphospho)-2-C-methyl-D-erythritol kinase [Thiorhodovibrio winogradskyi]|nr:4-(cytidine 5'-diphospho)-2-C-methyl-D-erythritol kinase [Thiorhodovibrio winogradskyi]